MEAQPAKRGPGRPRKVAVAPTVEPDAAPIVEAPVADAPVDDSDSRIGQACGPNQSSVGYGDGSTYRCENGKIVERVI